MKITLRIDSQNARQVRFTVFMNGANCGQLTTTVQEYQTFAVLLMSAGHEMLIDVSADAPTLVMPLAEAA